MRHGVGSCHCERSPDRLGLGLEAHLYDLPRVLLVRDRGLMVVHGLVDGPCGLVLIRDRLVERVRCVFCSLRRRAQLGRGSPGLWSLVMNTP